MITLGRASTQGDLIWKSELQTKITAIYQKVAHHLGTPFRILFEHKRSKGSFSSGKRNFKSSHIIVCTFLSHFSFCLFARCKVLEDSKLNWIGILQQLLDLPAAFCARDLAPGSSSLYIVFLICSRAGKHLRLIYKTYHALRGTSRVGK